MKRIKKIIIISLIIILLLVGIYFIIYFIGSKQKLKINNSNSYYIYDNKKNLMNGLSDEWVKLKKINKYAINATISIEDKNFYKHQGFDFLRIGKSLYVNAINKENLQGASTISQQYTKNLFLDFNKTWKRKFKEAWLTVRLESQYSKNEILEGYLNTINYGEVYGIENASHYYFNKDAKNLNLAEASMLAGIPKSPNNYSPLVNEKKAKERQLLVLEAMVKNKFITETQKENAYNKKLNYYGYIRENKLDTLMYYQDAVMKELNSIENIPNSFLDTGGLKIYTYLDMDAQEKLEQALKDNNSNDKLQTAAVMMKPKTGQVIALIGGNNYAESQYNRAIQAKRQVGSTLKPFLYYSALENGFTASTTFTSEPTTFVLSKNKTYSPSNYNDNYGNKQISMGAAIAYSDNIYAVKTHMFLGENTLVDTLKRVGITTSLTPIPSLALGSQEINLMEMVNAYSTLANLGYKVNNHLIKKVEDMDGNVLYEAKEEEEKILNSSIVFITNELLTSTYNYNFIDYNYPTCYDMTDKLTNKYAIKTGTTDTDHLIFGYNKDIVLGIWSGYDNSDKTDSSVGKKIRSIWAQTMENYFQNKKAHWYKVPKNVVGTIVDPISGQITNEHDKKGTIFYYIKGTQPSYDDSLDNLIPTSKNIDNIKEE